MTPMNRREALKTTTALLGGVLVGSSESFSDAARDAVASTGSASADDETLIEEMADTLCRPRRVARGEGRRRGPTINLLLTECYKPDAQQRVVQGLSQFRTTCGARCGKGFASLPRREREQLLREIDAEAQKNGDTHYFTLVRELAHGAYFSSQIGATQALRYVPVPGRFDGCVPLTPDSRRGRNRRGETKTPLQRRLAPARSANSVNASVGPRHRISSTSLNTGRPFAALRVLEEQRELLLVAEHRRGKLLDRAVAVSSCAAVAGPMPECRDSHRPRRQRGRGNPDLNRKHAKLLPNGVLVPNSLPFVGRPARCDRRGHTGTDPCPASRCRSSRRPRR